VKPSWQILPQLDEVAIKLIGDNKAAGSVSTIEFSFKAVSKTTEIQIVALEPYGFDFTQGEREF
jgi:hypothetical protein